MKFEDVKIEYDQPTQVRFIDAEACYSEPFEYEKPYLGGIAYGKEIICGCCGGVVEIEEILEAAEAIGLNPFKAIIPEEWRDISNEIKGE